MSDENYVRLNHFHGQTLETEDFQDQEQYHIKKMRLHARAQHAYGIVQHSMGGLEVVARGGGMEVEVGTGYAIDGDGRDIFLYEPVIETIDLEKFNPPATCYVTIKYIDEPTEFTVNARNPKYKGHARIKETSKVELTKKAPHPGEAIELARIQLEKHTEEISEPVDDLNPGPGEVDRRYVPRAGLSGCFFKPELRHQALVEINHTQPIWAKMGFLWRFGAAAQIYQTLVLLDVMLRGNIINFLDDAGTCIESMLGLQKHLIEEMKDKGPDLVDTEEFQDFKSHTDKLVDIFGERGRWTEERFIMLLERMRKGADAIAAFLDKYERPDDMSAMKAELERLKAELLAAMEPEPEPEPEEEEEEEEYDPNLHGEPKPDGAVECSWQELEEMSGKLPDLIWLEKRNFTLKDEIFFGRGGNDKAHSFQVYGERQAWRTRGAHKYPDGSLIIAQGEAHVGGASQWEISGLEEGKDIVMAKRIDYARGELKSDIYADGRKVGTWEIKGSDKRARWRNWLFRIPGEFVNGEKLTIKQEATEAERDINMFGLWFYQAKLAHPFPKDSSADEAG